GDGPMRLEIESFIKKNGLEDRVILHGVVKDLSPILLQSICLVAPSRLEGLPLVFLEAFQHQLPIVSFDSFPAISDIITEAETGFIIQQGDIMSAVDKMEFLYLESKQNQLMG
ncbi:MAG: glycosyltransferase, partial [Bacillota bacterium]|nr:glycosyltransferase [Bacillota bacterium]